MHVKAGGVTRGTGADETHRKVGRSAGPLSEKRAVLSRVHWRLFAVHSNRSGESFCPTDRLAAAGLGQGGAIRRLPLPLEHLPSGVQAGWFLPERVGENRFPMIQRRWRLLWLGLTVAGFGAGIPEGACQPGPGSAAGAGEPPAEPGELMPAEAGDGFEQSSSGSLDVVPREWSVSMRWENDTFGGTDRFYTDGASLSVVHTGGGWLESVADWLPWGEGRRSVGYDLGQVIVTSADKLQIHPDPDDRPYAGVLLAGVTLHVERGPIYHGLKFIAGVVGPSALAEETQKEVHRWVGADQPQGWDYQLRDEPVFNLVYEHRRRYRLWGSGAGLALEALPTATVMLGNLLTQAQLGGQLRMGFRLPDDFGVTLMRGMGHLPPPRRLESGSWWSRIGGYGYGGIHGNLVLHNITLDGNTWKASRSVDKEWLVPAAEVGVAVTTSHVVAAFSYVLFGSEFEGQLNNSEFGAFTFTYQF